MLSVDFDIGDVVLKDGWDVDLEIVNQARDEEFVIYCDEG